MKSQNQNKFLHQKPQRIPWNLKIKAKTKHFHLNFTLKSSTLSSFFDHCSHQPQSLIFNLKFLKCQIFFSSNSIKPSIKSKLIRFFRKLIPRKSENSTIFTQKRAVNYQPRRNLCLILLAAMLVYLLRYHLLKILEFDEAKFGKFLDYLFNYVFSLMY